MQEPKNLKYTKTHEWVKQEDKDILTVGITHHAQHLLGELVFVELPTVGQSVSQGKEIAVVESVKAASDVYAPISGQVVNINERLRGTPNLVNTDPYGEGWVFRIKPERREDLNNLLGALEYEAHINRI